MPRRIDPVVGWTHIACAAITAVWLFGLALLLKVLVLPLILQWLPS